MRLSAFIEAHIEDILLEWDSFAKTLIVTRDHLNPLVLRDHAREMLIEVLRDTGALQGPWQPIDRTKGHTYVYHQDESAANIHGALRHEQGFSVPQVATEFQALRAAVLRLWLPHISVLGKEVAEDIVRFNVAIDKALAESIVTYREFAAPNGTEGQEIPNWGTAHA